MYARVLPDLGEAATDALYTYHVPPSLQATCGVGTRVRVPLGARQVTGFVLELCAIPDVAPDRLRPLTSILAATPAFTSEQATLVRWLAQTYLCPLSEALRPCLADPGGASPRLHWYVADMPGTTTLVPDPTQSQLLDFLRAHPGASTAHLRAQLGAATSTALDALRRSGLITPTPRTKARGREIQVLATTTAPAALAALAATLPARAAKQAQLLRWIATALSPATEPALLPLSPTEVARQAGVSAGVVRTCLQHGWLSLVPHQIRRDPWLGVEGRKHLPPPLTAPQQAAVAAIRTAVEGQSAESFLLYGITGSGKTEVFLHAIDVVLRQGRQAIVLVPEISLTAQAMALYHGRFPGKVAVLHSHLSPGERFDEWQRIASGAADVVLGARSAVFAPCPRVGLLIIDEEHESSYKQESSPRYQAKRVALERGRLSGAPVVLASATPSLETMREADLGQHTVLQLPARIEARPLPTVHLVDLRRMTTNARILTPPLRAAITTRLADQQQTILFLNRRGFAYSLLCGSCGHQEGCPHCAVPLTFHKDPNLLRCHHCDYHRRPTPACPHCQGVFMAYKGVGTERLEQEVAALWPQARLGRLDRDTTARKGAHQTILDRFGREETDILIGTQMVAKGLDFPKVTLVGVIAADTSLGIADFRAPERTFQLLTQVAGRAGRNQWPGEVFIQTFQPEHYAIQAAVRHDYQTFYAEELRKRGDSLACWPPLTGLINILINGEHESEVQATAAALARQARALTGDTPVAEAPMTLSGVLPGLLELLRDGEPEIADPDDPFGTGALLHRAVPAGLIVDGPAPCPLERLRGRYRYHVLLRGQDRQALRDIAGTLRTLTPPKGITIVIDVDPLSLA